MKKKWVLVTPSYLTLLDPMDCRPPASLSMEFSGREYWSGLPFPSPGDFHDQWSKPVSCIACRFSTIWAIREPHLFKSKAYQKSWQSTSHGLQKPWARLFPQYRACVSTPQMLVWILLLKRSPGPHTQRSSICISADVSAKWALFSWPLSDSPPTCFSSKGEAHFIYLEVFERLKWVCWRAEFSRFHLWMLCSLPLLFCPLKFE